MPRDDEAHETVRARTFVRRLGGARQYHVEVPEVVLVRRRVDARHCRPSSREREGREQRVSDAASGRASA